MTLPLLLLLACTPGPVDGPNVLIVVVDTLRWDRLSINGHDRVTSPAIDGLMRSSVRFDRAYSAAPWTLPAMASVMTGQWPGHHGALSYEARLPESAETLAERFAAQGYATAAMVGNPVAGSIAGLNQGFQEWDEAGARMVMRHSSEVVARRGMAMLEQLSRQEQPWLLWVHFHDPHYPYLPDRQADWAAERVGRLEGGEPIDQVRDALATLSPGEIQQLRDLYDEEIAHSDRWVGRLLNVLPTLGVADDTIVVFLSDHGEELVDRGWMGHTRTLYEELVHVPLSVSVPGASPGVVKGPVSTVSLAATLYELTGVKAPRDLQAESLVPLMGGEQVPEDAAVYFEVNFASTLEADAERQANKRGLLTGDMKVVKDLGSGRVELYALGSDPGERTDLAETQPAVVKELLPVLDRFEEKVKKGRQVPEVVEVGAEREKMLRALGYVE